MLAAQSAKEFGVQWATASIQLFARRRHLLDLLCVLLQRVPLILSCSMYTGVRTIMMMQIVVYLLPWIGFTVCLVMNYRPYGAAVTAAVIQILYVLARD
jgi:hypothetical protein